MQQPGGRGRRGDHGVLHQRRPPLLSQYRRGVGEGGLREGEIGERGIRALLQVAEDPKGSSQKVVLGPRAYRSLGQLKTKVERGTRSLSLLFYLKEGCLKIDKEIRKVVDLLNKAGIKTVSSCRGHGDSQKLFYIIFRKTKNADKEFETIFKCLEDDRLSLKRSSSSTMRLYSEYARESTFKSIVENLEKKLKEILSEPKPTQRASKS